jgi:hypothetical protein
MHDSEGIELIINYRVTRMHDSEGIELIINYRVTRICMTLKELN